MGAVDASLEIVGIEELYNYTTNSACLKLREKCANLPTEGLKIDEFITDDTNKRGLDYSHPQAFDAATCLCA